MLSVGLLVAQIHSVKEFSITFTNFPPSPIGKSSVMLMSNQLKLATNGLRSISRLSCWMTLRYARI